MTRLRVLVLAPDANPDSISTSLVGYSHAEALARYHAVTLVVRRGNEASVRRRCALFRGIEGIRVRAFDEFYAWSLRHLFKYDYGSHLLTAFNYPFSLAFEFSAWRRLRGRILAGDFDVVLRLLPVTSVLPSPFAFFLRKSSIPFVLGPINGGLPWPRGFSQAEKQREWVSRFRRLYRFLPFARSTFQYAAAIIAGSSHTCAEFQAHKTKLFFVPENGISPVDTQHGNRAGRQDPLRLIFVGRLVPYKGCDLALRAVAPLLKAHRAQFRIIGDGPERPALEQLAGSLGIDKETCFAGMLPHPETLKELEAADILVFPSVREFGGGVVFEALARGVVPVVAAFGGPGDIVTPEVGYTVSLTDEDDVVSQVQRVLECLEKDREHLHALGERGERYAHEQLSWDGKAQAITKVLTWAVGRGPKPDLHPPNRRPRVNNSRPVTAATL